MPKSVLFRYAAIGTLCFFRPQMQRDTNPLTSVQLGQSSAALQCGLRLLHMQSAFRTFAAISKKRLYLGWQSGTKLDLGQSVFRLATLHPLFWNQSKARLNTNV